MYHDEFTGLLNRKSLMQYMDSFHGDAVSSLGVMSIDINGLKFINQQYGFGYGNETIKSIANCLRMFFDEKEVYRLSGDEFLVISGNITRKAFYDKTDKFKRECGNINRDIICTGVIWSDKDLDVEHLVSESEEIMIISKTVYYQNSNIATRYYNPSLGKQLMDSIENGELVIYLQPKADMHKKDIKGAEALIRMMHPKKGIIYPNSFIPAYEKQNMIKNVDMFVFEEVLKTLKHWQDEGKQIIPVSLNFSRATALEPGLLETMEKIYKKYNSVDRRFIEIEITESMGDVEINSIKKICDDIKAKGYRVSLDDFGSKYSSMVMLIKINFDTIKIDKSIINEITANENDRILMKNIFAACNEMGTDIVAEGVETQEQFDLLAELGCTYAQGYLFNKAIPCGEFEERYIK